MSSAIAPAAAAIVEDVQFAASDGRVLTGRLLLPGGTPHFVTVLHGGAGFPARFYQDFASWLAVEKQAAVLIYDYRDFGWSRGGPPAQSDACLSDWGIKDQSAALSFLRRRFPALPPRVLAHSLGGQWLAFHDGIASVDRVAAVGSGPGFWLDHPWRMIPKAGAFWWLAGPIATKLAGYMPGRMLGLGADLPGGVYWEWRKLCLKRDYHMSEWGRAYPQPQLEEARFELTLVPIADDVLIAPHMVRKLPAFYPFAKVKETLLDPARLGVKAIGHAGAFLPRNRVCWPLIAAPLFD